MQYVLTERFCQDSLEEYFGNQRKLGRRNDNPDMRSFGYNDNTIRIQRSVSCQSGNTRGRKDKRKAWVNVCDEPVRKRSAKKCNQLIMKLKQSITNFLFGRSFVHWFIIWGKTSFINRKDISKHIPYTLKLLNWGNQCYV